jgi:glycosyltransferase involved in cell wall biosynthesis
MGGTSTVANVLAKGFISRGHFCALGYMLDKSEHPSAFFKHKILLVRENRKQVELFFQKHQFDIILNQIPNITDFEFLRSVSSENCKIISAYHSRPMFHFSMLETLIRIYGDSNKLLYKLYTLAKIPFLPWYWIQKRRQEIKIFSNINTYSDRILLLSANFFPNWMNLVPGANPSKLVAIGNPLVFDSSFSVESLKNKEKLVIVIYSNPVKRGNILLKIWDEIEADPRLNDWNFEFIGGGEGYDQVRRLALKLQLKRITFTGYQNTKPYYQRASLLLMTSRFEGWPMVLMEGHQMGVVPVSYHSFESITDIIDDGKNGLIIPNNDIDCFVAKLKQLMLNKPERERIAANAIESSERFSIEKVTNKYLDLFKEIITEKSNLEIT